MPGCDWVKSFLKRHPQLSQKIAQNISHARATTDEEIINNFLDNLEVELEGIPASNIWNSDETNLVDDPGQTKIVIKRGTKTETTKTRHVKRSKRLNVPPGKSICSSDFNNDTLTVENTTKTVDHEPGTPGIRQRKRLRNIGADRSSLDSSSENEDEVKYMESDDSTSDEHFFDDGDEQPTEENNVPSQKVEKSTGKYVVVQFEQSFLVKLLKNNGK
ncbi:unnamed protein product [Acanthoscelides obtectus]|uniref:N-acetyltransferase domain-containing protein n=1 Tax=Acanthoscelides obtectus TaxID=200917 RepID=A0A9P0M481_ACAOB|nr:unnamed protein product [Acanthoscelides obtectus]CAK1664156.1 hypothetical protein AOBTE_LOCUS24086 [Acanthoscelides obtectus]